MNAQQIISNPDFVVVAMTEAFELLSKDIGISVESLQEQFPSNNKLQETVAEIVAGAAKALA